MSNGRGDKVRCEICGLKRRGSNHEEGAHHQKEVKAAEAQLAKSRAVTT